MRLTSHDRLDINIQNMLDGISNNHGVSTPYKENVMGTKNPTGIVESAQAYNDDRPVLSVTMA